MQHAHIQFSLKLGNSVSGAGGSGPLSGLGTGAASKMLGGGGGVLPEATPGLHYFPEVPQGRPSREQDLADLMLSMQVGAAGALLRWRACCGPPGLWTEGACVA
jgi:hypothetical protein